MGRLAILIAGMVVFSGMAILISSEREKNIAIPEIKGNENVFVVGEKLVYRVRYGFISLGEITVTVNGAVETENGRLYHADADIASYSGVPFVSLHHIYSSDMTSDFYSIWFEALERNKDSWDVTRFNFDYDMMNVEVEEGARGNVMATDTLDIEGYLQDGLSLFYFARGFIRSEVDMTIPTLINKDAVTTDFVFNGKRDGKKSKVTDYPVDVIELRGNANFSGIFGLSGAFRGWFTNDDAAVPIEAKLRVLIGNVTIELIEWDRPGWTPPKYMSDR